MERFIGKYVCYGNDGGMFCWGRIKALTHINTAEGIKEAFILTDRMSGWGGDEKGKVEITRIKMDSLLRSDKVDLSQDIVDGYEAMLKGITDEELFLMSLDSDEVTKKFRGKISLGFRNMIDAQGGTAKFASSELKSKMGIRD